MNVLDLFSGIGGFSLGLERAGMKTVAFCEIEPYCRAVLNKHWPDVRIYEDVKKLTAENLASDGISVDIICGGFPCQDISYAGRGAGIEGERSGLWFEFHRLIKEIKPQYAIIENVSALRSRGLDQVLRSLAEIGYDAEWHCIPASAVGAPHRRDRIWIIAYPQADIICANSNCSRPHFEKIYEQREIEFRDKQIGIFRQMGDYVADPESERFGEAREFRSDELPQWTTSSSEDVANANSAQREGGSLSSRIHKEYANFGGGSWWAIEPDVGRVAHGVPAWVDRLRALGNAVVPQIPEIIGKAICRSS